MTQGSEWPRILLVAASPVSWQPTGTDVTLTNLIGSWPPGRLAQVFVGPTAEPNDVLGLGLAISPRNALLDYPVRRLINRSGALQGSSAPVSAGVPVHTHRDMATRAHMMMRFMADASPLILPRKLYAQARQFAPDVIYSLLGSLRVIDLTQRLVDGLKTPFVPHFMDDWVHTLYTSGEAWGASKKLLDMRIARLMRSAPAGMAISEPMADEYGREFGIPFTPVANSADDAFFDIPPKAEAEPLVVMYVGGLHVGRAKALCTVADALDRCRPASGSSARLVVHCPDEHRRLYGQDLQRRGRVTMAGSLRPDEVAAGLYEADVVLHVESADPETASFTRLSVSTKVPQYLAAGKPVLCFAPASLASAKLIVDSRGGLVASSQQELMAAAESLLSDVGRRRELGGAGRTYAREHFSRAVVVSRFHQVLRSVATPAD